MHVQFAGQPDDGITVSSHHARALALLGIDVSFADQAVDPASQQPRPDVIHLVTFEQLSNALLRHLIAARMAGTPIVRYWSGRDAVWAQHHEPSREFARALAGLGAIHLCRSQRLAEAIRPLGITGRILPVISANLSSAADPRSLPQTFSVLCYLPEDRFEFHGGLIVGELIRRLPLVRFLILGGAGRQLADASNVQWLAHSTDSVRAIHRSNVVLDARVDGGLSRIALEGLCHGRQVVTGHPLPHAFEGRSVEELSQTIRTIRDNPQFNLEGRSYVSREHEGHAAAKALRRELEDAIEPGRLNLALEGGVRGAAAALKNPQLLSPRTYPLPDTSNLPEDASALSALLRDMPQADPAFAV